MHISEAISHVNELSKEVANLTDEERAEVYERLLEAGLGELMAEFGRERFARFETASHGHQNHQMGSGY